MLKAIMAGILIGIADLVNLSINVIGSLIYNYIDNLKKNII